MRVVDRIFKKLTKSRLTVPEIIWMQIVDH